MNADMKMYSKIVKSGSADIYCEVYAHTSSMETLLLLHGNGEDLHYFDPQIHFFASQFNIVAIDSRSHGQSTSGTEGLDFDMMAKDVAVVMDALQIAKAHILGFSDGAIIALHLALSKPTYIQSMILVGANYNPQGLVWFSRMLVRLNYLYLSICARFSKKKKQAQTIWGLMVHHPHLTLEQLSNIKVPTLIITGEKDMVSQKQNNEMHRVIQNSQRIIIPKGDHFVSHKMSDAFNFVVEKFLKGILEHKT